MSELKNRKDIRTSLKKVFWSSKYHSKDLQVILDEKNATPYNPLGGGWGTVTSAPPQLYAYVLWKYILVTEQSYIERKCAENL